MPGDFCPKWKETMDRVQKPKSSFCSFFRKFMYTNIVEKSVKKLHKIFLKLNRLNSFSIKVKPLIAISVKVTDNKKKFKIIK